MSDNEFFGGRRRRRGNGGDAFSPYTLFASGEQGVWYDPSDLTPEKVSWRRNLLTYSQDFDNAAWTKSNASILSNLALYSQDFDNAAWAKTSSTVTANTAVAPDGTTTADKLVTNSAATAGRIIQTVTVTAVPSVFSVYAKADGWNWLLLTEGAPGGGKEAFFNISTGAVGTVGASTVASVESVGNGWYRCSIAFTAAAGATGYRIYSANADNNINIAGNGVDGALIWGAQLVPGSTAQTYTRSLATAAPIQFADPLGGTLADKLVENTATNVHLMSQSPSVTGGTTMTLSAYVKAAERTFARIDIVHTGVANYPTYFNLANGTIASQSTGNTSTITALGDGWYRVTLSRLMNATQTQAVSQIGPSDIDRGAGSSGTYTGDGVSGIYVYGAQVEQASTASAYQRITDFSSDFLAAFPTHALYQDSVGTTPVTALGQSVGLVIDKRLGGASNLGPELLGNPSFNSSANYSLLAGATISGGQLFIDNQSASRAEGLGNFLPSGKWLQVEMDIASTSGSVMVLLADAVGSLNIDGGTYSSTGVSRRYVYSAGTNGNFRIIRNTGATVINSISFREVPGNHALQATSAARPTLQARSNLLTYTEQFDNAAWGKLRITATANQEVAPDGTTTADLVAANAAGALRCRQDFTGLVAGTPYVVSLYAKKATVGNTAFILAMNTGETLSTGRTINLDTNVVTNVGTNAYGSSAVTITDAGNGWKRLVFPITIATGETTLRVSIAPIEASVSGTENVYLWGAQLEQASTATTYQRVVTATDYADVGLPRNLTFDGIDDSLATAGNVDFSATDKVTLFSGVTKLSDAALAVMTELSADINSNAGTFVVRAPSTAATGNYGFFTRGSSTIRTPVAAGYAAPITNVLTGLGDIGGQTALLRINGSQVATDTGSQGTGNYGSYLLYVGRRGGTTLPFNGRLFQLVIRGAATDSVTVGNAERWVGQLTGVAL